MESVLNSLKQSILKLEGYKSSFGNAWNVKPFQYAFPNKTFPIGAIHEITCTSPEDNACSIGFITALLSTALEHTCLWITQHINVFPPALKLFGLEPDKFIFIKTSSNKETLWTIEEALKCEQLTAVVGEIKNIDFTASRRLQLAVEESNVNGFIIRNNPINTIASIARWKITSLPSESLHGLPGVAFPRWNVELLKVRNGKPQSWQVEWSNNKLKSIAQDACSISSEKLHKVG
jgi:protein ImuA